MQSVSSRIWTRVAVFISYDDNDYTTGTSSFMGHGNSIQDASCVSIVVGLIFSNKIA